MTINPTQRGTRRRCCVTAGCDKNIGVVGGFFPRFSSGLELTAGSDSVPLEPGCVDSSPVPIQSTLTGRLLLFLLFFISYFMFLCFQSCRSDDEFVAPRDFYRLRPS